MTKTARNAQKSPASDTTSPDSIDDGKKLYAIGEGVEVVNGRKTRDARDIRLTDIEAAYDLAHGHITLTSSDVTTADG